MAERVRGGYIRRSNSEKRREPQTVTSKSLLMASGPGTAIVTGPTCPDANPSAETSIHRMSVDWHFRQRRDVVIGRRKRGSRETGSPGTPRRAYAYSPRMSFLT